MSIGSDGQREREPHNELTVSEVFKDGWPTVKVPFVMVWGSHEQIIGPGDSFFIKQGTQYGYGNKYAKFLLIQINPVEGNPWKELAHIYSNSGEIGVRRAREETEQWF